MLSKLFLGLLLMCSLLNVQDIDTLNAPKDAQSLYDISLTDISGAPLDLSQYKGKKILFVNVASKCGFTSQYDGLQELYKTYKDKLVVIGLPCNQFGGQEPGTAKEIESFCRANYGVDFPLSSKIEVKGASNDFRARPTRGCSINKRYFIGKMIKIIGWYDNETGIIHKIMGKICFNF